MHIIPSSAPCSWPNFGRKLFLLYHVSFSLKASPNWVSISSMPGKAGLVFWSQTTSILPNSAVASLFLSFFSSQLHSTQSVFPSFPKFSLFLWYATLFSFFGGGAVHCVVCGALVPWPGIKLLPTALGAQSPPKNYQGSTFRLLIFLHLKDCSRDYMQHSTFPLYFSVCHTVIILLIFF